MVLASRSYRQQATYWGSPVIGGFGSITFSAPEVLDCRWEDRAELFTNAAGEDSNSRAVVFTFKDLDVDGFLFLGVSEAIDPTQVEGALRIQRSDEVPDLRGLNSEYRTYL